MILEFVAVKEGMAGAILRKTGYNSRSNISWTSGKL